MKKITFFLATFIVVSAMVSTPVSAAGLTVGNDSTARTVTDTRADFAIVDTNHPATVNGSLTSFSYYASTTNTFRFIVVDGSNVIKWVSEEITPVDVGVNNYSPATPVDMEIGWNIGMYFKSTGTIPFDYGGTPAPYTFGGIGTPVVGNSLVIDNYSGRTYSLVATGTLTCATIDDGTITDVNGNTIVKGYDQWGYNYQAHMFNGFADNYSRPTVPVTSGDKLIMKWSDAWLANVDCNGDGKLDRGLVDGVVNGTSMGWLTNHYNGTVDVNGKTKRYTDFYKIVWTGPGSPLWGQYTVIQEVWNDPSAGYHGLYDKTDAPGFGLNGQWTEL